MTRSVVSYSQCTAYCGYTAYYNVKRPLDLLAKYEKRRQAIVKLDIPHRSFEPTTFRAYRILSSLGSYAVFSAIGTRIDSECLPECLIEISHRNITDFVNDLLYTAVRSSQKLSGVRKPQKDNTLPECLIVHKTDVSLKEEVSYLKERIANLDNYSCFLNPSILCIFSMVENPERTGNVTEALAAETLKQVYDPFVKSMLYGKIAQDSRDVDMINIIWNSKCPELVRIYSTDTSFLNLVRTAVVTLSPDVQSSIASNLPVLEKTIKSFNKAFTAMQGN